MDFVDKSSKDYESRHSYNRKAFKKFHTKSFMCKAMKNIAFAMKKRF